jgi:hypothetical protein
MNGFIAGLILCIVLTVIGVFSIMYSRIHGMASISIIQASMLVKLMLSGVYTMALFKLVPLEIEAWSYGMTVGLYSCVAFPIIAYYATRNDLSKR